MGKESLLRLVQKIVEEKYEGDDIELKSGHEGNPKAFYDTLSSFSNTRGGTIIFGIDEKKNYELCGVKDFVGVRKTIEEVCKQMVPPVRAIISEAQDAEGRHFVAAEIPELPYTEKPCYYYPLGVSKGSFVRNGEADEPMSEFEIYEYELEKHQKSSETQTLPNLTDDNIDQNQLNVFLSLATRNKPNLMNLDRNTVLTMLGMRKDGKPTLACLLCFGKYPQEFAPLLNINCVRINGEEYVSEDTTFNRFAANATIGGNLPQMLDAALYFIATNMTHQVILGTDGKRMNGDEYPLLACRELLLNCLVHRDYSDRSATIPISVTFYSNRLEFKNPGGLFAGTKIEDLGRNYCPVRNPFLCSCLEILSQTENRHSGIPTVYAEMRKANLLAPLFESKGGFFKATIFNVKKSSTVKNKVDEDELIRYCRRARLKSELAVHFGFKAERATYFFVNYVKPLVDQGILEYTIPSSPGSKYQRIILKCD